MGFNVVTNMGDVVKLKVVGVGGGGGNAVKRMVEEATKSTAELLKKNKEGEFQQWVEFISINTDLQALNKTSATVKIQIGEKLTKGQGAGANPEKGRKSAEESRAQIAEVLNGTDMVFITAGMGGGTGTGAAPVVAQIAKEMNILTVGVVTRPFGWEGGHRAKYAEEGIQELSKHVDSLVIIPNDKIKETAAPGEKITVKKGLEKADEVLQQSVSAICNLIYKESMMNLDFADICTIMTDGGLAHMGYATATGDDRAEKAATASISSPLMEQTIENAKGLIINVAGPEESLGIEEAETAAEIIRRNAAPDVNLIFGMDMDPDIKDEIRITVIATGFPEATLPPKSDVGSSQKPETLEIEVLRELPRQLPVQEQPITPAPIPVTPPTSTGFHSFSPSVGQYTPPTKVEKPAEELFPESTTSVYPVVPPAPVQPVSVVPVTTGAPPPIPQPINQQPVAPQPVAPQPVAPQPVVPQPVAQQPTPQPVAPPVAPQPFTYQSSVGSGLEAPVPFTTDTSTSSVQMQNLTQISPPLSVKETSFKISLKPGETAVFPFAQKNDAGKIESEVAPPPRTYRATTKETETRRDDFEDIAQIFGQNSLDT